MFFVDGKPRPEKFAQLLFLGIAVSYCQANDLDIAPESDGGAGPVDFKFSSGQDNVLVEMKLSTNSQLVSGYRKQVDAYSEAESAKLAHYVVIDVGKLGKKMSALEEVRKTNVNFKKTRIVHLIDGSLRDSASKRH